MFINTIKIEATDDFQKIIDVINDLTQNGDYVFRGYGKQDELFPNIIREKNYESVELNFLKEFEKYGSNYFKANTPIDFLSYAQHFGLPTRLLDFTYNPFIALSFAIYMPKNNNYKNINDRDYYYICYSSIKDNLCTPEIPLNDEIYNSKYIRSDSLATKAAQCIDSVTDLFGSNNLNRNYSSLVGLQNLSDFKEIQNKINTHVILFVSPNQSNQRIIMQQGLFMFPYTLDKNAHIDILSRNSSVLMIHKNFRNEIIQYLDKLGYNAFRLMPDLASICEAVKRRVTDERSEKREGFKNLNSRFDVSKLNTVQYAAYELIREDAMFIYALTNIMQNAKNIKSNFICMSLPYIGIFADGAEQWGKKVGAKTPQFNSTQKDFYSRLRQGHKLFEKSYDEYRSLLLSELSESDNYFYKTRSLIEKAVGYKNIGTDLCNNEFCGNTILCAMYLPIRALGNENAGSWIKNISVIAGELAGSFGCADLPVYNYNDSLNVHYKDYHLYNDSPLKMNNDTGFLLFSIICSINFVIEFIEHYFIDEIPQKFKFAYLQYFYLCDFVDELNNKLGTSYKLDKKLYNKGFRNCLAHYGLGQFIKTEEINNSDILKGLTVKAFNMDYYTAKTTLYEMLRNLVKQIKADIL